MTSWLYSSICGTTGMLLNIAVAFIVSNDPGMTGTTCCFMVQLAIADAMVLCGMQLAPAVAACLGYPEVFEATILGKLMAYCNACGYRTSTIFNALVSFSRWVYFVQRHWDDVLFSKNRIRLCLMLTWILAMIMHSPFLYHQNAFTLIHGTGVYMYTNDTVSRVLQVISETDNWAALVVQVVFNSLSAIWIISQRKQALTPALRALHRRELKLFSMCIVDSCVYCLLHGTRYVFYLVQVDMVGVVVQALYLVNHVDCAIMHLLLNQKLRHALITFFQRSHRRNRSKDEPQTVLTMADGGGRNFLTGQSLELRD